MRIAEFYGLERPVFSFEFFPPATEAGHNTLMKTIDELRGLAPDFISVTYGAGGSTRDRTLDLVSFVKNDVGIEAMAHLTCVGASREEISSVLDRLQDAGIENVIALRGDPPKGETEFVPHPDGLTHATELVHLIREEKRPFCLAAACYPEKHVEAQSMESDLEHLNEKVNAGAEVLISQLFFDNEAFLRFRDRASAAGITVPIVAGIMPITNLSQIERFTGQIGATIPRSLHERLDPHREDNAEVERIGTEYGLAQCEELLAEGVQGVHFYTLNKSQATRNILAGLRTSA
ncbi:MAG: methylenetetrahydrofolate reductase (NADPH) [Hyphomicrobiaceae bacterium]|jgi:methylenetetrahydrofolate reductase (NADPH)